jgi:hypothetical protein
MPDFSNIILEYDSSKRVLHLSARSRVYIDSIEKLNNLCETVGAFLNKNVRDGKCFMVVELPKIAIDTKLVDEYSKHIKGMYEKYIYDGGLLRYGFEITRITAQIGHKKHLKGEPLLFRNQDEAFAYIDKILASNEFHPA